MQRVVLDTNVLISSAYDELSASSQILDACRRGRLTAVVSPQLKDEYAHTLARAVRIRGHEETVREFLASTELVEIGAPPAVVRDDPEDDKVIATAVVGHADAIITNDRHLLDLDPYAGMRILRPTTFLQLRADEGGGTWNTLARMIGLPGA